MEKQNQEFSTHTRVLIHAGARGSELSKQQFSEVLGAIKYFYPQVDLQASWIDTRGDRDKISSLRTKDQTDFFTDAIDRELLSGKIDIAIHSAKDLPSPLAKGLELAALTKGLDPSDSLVLRPGAKLQDLMEKKSVLIATSSIRREQMVYKLLPHAKFSDLRGTVPERLKQLVQGNFDAIVVATAALIRLGIHHFPTVQLEGKTVEGQGQLAIVCRSGDKKILELFSILDWRHSRPKSLYLGLKPSKFYPQLGKLDFCPVIETSPIICEKEEIENKILRPLQGSTIVLITSARSSQYLIDLLKKIPDGLKSLFEKQIYAIGPATAEAFIKLKHGQMHILPYGSSAESLIDELKLLREKPPIFYPHSAQSRKLLKEFLLSSNWPHDDCILYTTSHKEIPQHIRLDEYDEIIFTSPSTAHSFFSQRPRSCICDKKITALGKITQKALEKYDQRANLALPNANIKS